jgi:flagellar FliL protein
MAKEEEAKEAPEAKGGGKKKIILMAVPILLIVAGAGWFFLIKPSSSAGAVAKALPEPTPGTLVTMTDAITINLASGHFLKFAMSLQPTAAAKEVTTDKAIDLAITEFSGRTLEDLETANGRAEAKDALIARIKLAYLPEGKLTEAQIEAENKKVSGGKVKETADLTDAQAEKRAAALTVQPDVYNIYLTEFVMQ